MPAIDVAMERSITGGFKELLVASLRPVFERRDLIQDAQGHISDVKTAFSSWDNCMHAVYCKWPVIGIIIIGGLILISVAWCIIRCACCGLSCCCECFQCLKCCGDCCGCCDPPKGKSKYSDEPLIPPHHASGYKSHDPMVPGPAAPFGSRPPAAFEPPQYAEFDVSKTSGARVHEDALPAMPSWEGAGSKKVLVEGEEVEMDQLEKPDNSLAFGDPSPIHGQNVPLMAGAGAGPGLVNQAPPPSRQIPYSPPGSTSQGGEYMANAGANVDPYATNAHGYGNYSDRVSPYQQPVSTFPGTDQGYGMVTAAAGGASRPPQEYRYGGGYGQGSQPQQGYGTDIGPVQASDGASHVAAGHGSYGQTRQGSHDTYNGSHNQGYGRGQGQNMPPRGPPVRQDTGGYPQERITQSPPPMGSEYGNGPSYPPQRSDSPAPAAAAASQAQQSYEMPAEPSNNGGFGFTSSYTRPARTTPVNEYGGYGQRQTHHLPQQSGGFSGYRGWQ